MCNCNENINPCSQTSQVNCDCPVKDLKSDCVVFTQDLPCTEIEAGQTLTETLVLLDEAICEKISQLDASINLINTGTGAEIYSGIDNVGKRKIRKIKEGDNLVDIVQNTEDISIGLDETNLTNFIQNNQKTDSLNNLGSGAQIYKNSVVTGNNTQHNFRTVVSDTLSVTTTTDNVKIELPSEGGIAQFIVNSDYTGTEQLGTIQKPFKNTQNALNAFVGNGTNLSPQNAGVIITVQKDTNVFTGSLAYSGLNMILKSGASLVSNPSTGNFLIDLDSSASLPVGMSVFSNTTPVSIKITLEEGSAIVLQKEGFNNSGTTLNTNSSNGKRINLIGKGVVSIANDSNISSPSTRAIIKANTSNASGFFNDGNVANFDIQTNLVTNNTRIVQAGLNSKIYFTDSTTQFNDTVVSYNEQTVPYEFSDATLSANDCNFINYNKTGLLLNNFCKLSGASVFRARNSNIGGTCNYLFENSGSSQPELFLNNCFNDGIISTSIAKSSSVLWDNSTFIDCYFYSGSIDPLQFKLKVNFLNNIGGKILATLQNFTSKANAVSGGLTEGNLFRKRKVVNAVDLVADVEYQVATSGSPSLGTVGSFFTATGSETGTGTAYLDTLEII